MYPKFPCKPDTVSLSSKNVDNEDFSSHSPGFISAFRCGTHSHMYSMRVMAPRVSSALASYRHPSRWRPRNSLRRTGERRASQAGLGGVFALHHHAGTVARISRRNPVFTFKYTAFMAGTLRPWGLVNRKSNAHLIRFISRDRQPHGYSNTIESFSL